MTNRRDELRLLVEYLRAVSNYWWAVVAGLTLAVVDFVERIFATWFQSPLWLRVTLGLTGLVVAQFLAYRELAIRHRVGPISDFLSQMRTVFRTADLKWAQLKAQPSIISQVLCKHVKDFQSELEGLYSICPPSWDSSDLKFAIDTLNSTSAFHIGGHIGSEEDAGQIASKMETSLALIRNLVQ